MHKYSLQPLNISTDWTIVRNVFYDLDPSDNVPEDDKYYNIYCQEDLLLLTKGNDYFLDLGWYGSDDFTNDRTGYCIHLFKGRSWNNDKLLEKFLSRDKQVIVEKIKECIEAVNHGKYDDPKWLRR